MKRIGRIATCSALMLYAAGARAQTTGTVTGSVHDQKTGGELVGANVLLVGTALGAAADLDGKFTIRGVPPGTYELRISYIGYTAKVIQGVVVGAGQTASVDVLIGQAVEEKAKEEVVVTAQRNLSTEAAVLSERKKAATIGDAISAEQIKRSPDTTSGDAIKRVTGVTIADDKFVFIRGVTDRYNGTSLNGTSVTSTDTDVDRKSFSFDLVPSNLVENTVVIKTATPDLPGDFSGGLVQVNTLDFPARRTGRFGFSGGWDRSTTHETMLAAPGGGHDWLAKDDGSRALPPENPGGNTLATQLPNDWQLHAERAPVNNSFALSYGDRHALGDDELGYVAALSYRNEYETGEFSQRPSFQGVPLFSFDGDRYKRTLLWGGLLNFNYKLNGLNKFGFKNNFVQSAQEKVAVSEGLPASGEFTRKQTTEWDQRTFYLGQLTGAHKIPALGGVDAEWRAFYSDSKAEEPNREQVSYERGAGDVFSLKENYRTWAELNEDSHGGGVDLAHSWSATKLKFGGYYERRRRDYGIQAYSTDASTVQPPNYGLLVLPVDQVFAPENYGPGKFRFVSVTTFTGAYDGDQRVGAGYVMGDMTLGLLQRQLRLVGGARVEDTQLEVTSIPQAGAQPVTARLDETDVLPSVNLAWLVREDTNVRLAYSRSLNRPEFRELADVLYYDFDNEQNVLGNPDLKRAVIDNYDVRLEWFPHVGEVLAGSLFYKQLENAIEEELIPSPERFVRTWFNSPTGKNYGYELEARKGLGFVAPALQGVSVTGNYTRVHSKIEYTEKRTDPGGNAIITQQERVMQGQAPWTVNLSLLYVVPRFGTSANLLYGKVGRRLEAVGDSRDEDVYEESRDLLDLAITQRFRGRYEAKFTAKNLLSEDELYTSGPERSTFAQLSKSPVYSLLFAFGL